MTRGDARAYVGACLIAPFSLAFPTLAAYHLGHGFPSTRRCDPWPLFLCKGNEERRSAMEDEEKQVHEGGSTESPTDDDATKGATESGAGAAQPDYSMLMQMMQEMQENQTRLAGQIAKISDAQSALIDAGAVIHEDGSRRPGLVDEQPTDDEFVPIERLDLSI